MTFALTKTFVRLGFALDVAGHADERPFRLPELGDQTRSDASPGSVFWAGFSLRVRRGAIPVVSEDRHPKTFTKAHVEWLLGNSRVHHHGYTPIQDFRNTID